MNDLDPHLPPLDPEVEKLLRFERERPGLGAARSERMWGIIATELAVGAVPAIAQAASLPTAANPLASVAGTAGKLALVKALPWVAVSLSVASAGGFVAGQKIANQKLARASASAHVGRPAPGVSPAVLPQGSPEMTPPSAASTVQLPSDAPPAPLVQSPAAHRKPIGHRQGVPAEATHSAAALDDLAEEAQMLAHAESALRAGDWAGALAASDAYVRRFPHGQLAEEAAYLGVRACEGSGDASAAQTRIEELRRRFPQSPLASPVNR